MLQSAAMHRIRKALFLLTALLLALPAESHPVPFSYLDIQLRGAALEISLTAPHFRPCARPRRDADGKAA